MQRPLSRRSVLKAALATGTLLSLPLPTFDAMLNGNGNAYAAGEPLVRRYCTWFFGNGISPPLWVPTATGSGASWALSEQLLPLKNVKSSLTVVSGLKNMLPNTMPHPGGSAASTTGGPLVNDAASAASIDQIVAGLIAAGTSFPSLELGVSDATPNGVQTTLHAVSHRAGGGPNYPEFDPHKLFARLFSQTSSAATSADQIAKMNLAKKSVLDMFATDAAELGKSLGTRDRARLEQHLDGIRQIELRLQTTATAKVCTSPADPTTLGVLKDTKSEAPSSVNAVMSDLLTVAFACDLTRVASVVFTLPAAHVFYRSLGADMNDDFHDTICHTDAGDEAHQPRVHRGVVYAMTNLAVFLEKLSRVVEGDGTLLDRALVYATSCTAWGKVHGVDDWPVLLAGKAGGALKGDLHLRAPGENLSKVLLSIANVMGGTLKSIGGGAGLVTSGLSGLV